MFTVLDNKKEKITFRVTEEEKEIIKQICKIKKISMSEYVYSLVCRDLQEFTNFEDYEDFLQL